MYVMVLHNNIEIVKILDTVAKTADHQWWETLLGWGPVATEVFNLTLHLVVAVLIGHICLSVVSIARLVWICCL